MIATGVERLHLAAADGRLARLGSDFGLDLIVLFGSAAADADRAGDIDLAVRGTSGLDLPALTVEMMDLCGIAEIDVADLRRASPLLRKRALVDGELLWEAAPHVYVEASIVAMTMYMDTAWLRRRQLEALAG